MKMMWNTVCVLVAVFIVQPCLVKCDIPENGTAVAENPDVQHLRSNCSNDLIVEKEFIIYENGSLLANENQHVYDHQSYIVDNDTAYICNNSSENAVEYNFSEEFQNCGHIFLLKKEFQLLDNGTLFVSTYNAMYEPTDFFLSNDGAYICVPNFKNLNGTPVNETEVDNMKFSHAFWYVTIVGIMVSIVSLVLHLIVFCCVSKVRNLPGCCLASLSLSLLLAYFCFMSPSLVHTKTQCANIGMASYYFFLASFFWMNTIAFDVWRSFRVVVRELRISSHRVPWRRFLIYSMYSWLVPAIFLAVVIAADQTDAFPEDFRPSFGSPACWFNSKKPLLVFFATPLFLVMFLNGIFFLDSAYVINVASMQHSQVNEVVLRRRFFMFMRLAVLMGLTWIIGIIAAYVDVSEAIWFIFIILNTLQGLFIFVVFSCSSKVRTLILERLKKKANIRHGTSIKTISQITQTNAI